MQSLEPAAKYAVSGSVTGASGDPLARAAISLEGAPFGTIADQRGRFGIEGIRAGDYRILVTHAGFRSARGQFTIPGDPERTFTLNMFRAPETGSAVVDSLGPVTLEISVRAGS
jgi:hypothetical protein